MTFFKEVPAKLYFEGYSLVVNIDNARILMKFSFRIFPIEFLETPE